jgi:hypothetical protein
MNPAEPSRMRLKLRLALRLGWRDRGVNLNAVVVEAVGKEHWDRSHDPREAMVGGLARSGRVIFAAGAVMVAVFLTLALSGPLPPKEVGSSSASRCCWTRCSWGLDARADPPAAHRPGRLVARPAAPGGALRALTGPA